MAKSLSKRSRSHTQSRLGVVPFASGLVTQRAARESLRGPQCRSGKWAGALAPELLALWFFVFCLFRCLQPARASLHRTLNVLLPFWRQGCAPDTNHNQCGLLARDLGRNTRMRACGGVPRAFRPSRCASAGVVGRTEASGPANAQVVGSKESLVANTDVLQAPPLGSAPRGARVYVDVSDCHRSASLTTGPAVARCRSKRLLWKSPPSAPPAAGLVSPSVLMQSRWLQKSACSPCTMVC